MTPYECPREAEVVAAVRQRAWRPEDEDLRRHVEACAVCAEVESVCQALVIDGEALRGELAGHAALPSAGQVWLRATLRARAEGVQAASRSLLLAYGMAGAAVAGVTGGVAWQWWPEVKSVWSRFEWTGPAPDLLLPLMAVGACLALATVAVYLAVRGDQRL
jgi:hypothetical protein